MPLDPNADINKDYCNDDCPVFSFLYALYCDEGVNKGASRKWRESYKDGTYSYFNYLDNYTQERKREFPVAARTLINILVAKDNKPIDEGMYKGLFTPNPDQTTKMFDEFLRPELTTPRTTRVLMPLSKAVFDPSRPLLSLLGLALINEDRNTVLAALPHLEGNKEIAALSDAVKATSEAPVIKTLTDVLTNCWQEDGRPCLRGPEATAIRPMLIAALMYPPPVW